MTLGETLRMKRVIKGLTQFDLASEAKISLRSVQNAEADAYDTKWSTISAIAKVLELNLGDLDACIEKSEDLQT
ncbi:MAG: helix-turn-helix transcriptional regulator [Clostridiales bacterium]|nr:helix-turn-helix transcriptional regulator [Clostridiales bacterium]